MAPPGSLKPPGLMSFVVWRQFFMVLAAPGVATSLAPVWGLEQFLVAMLIAAAPSLVHGQLWKWTYDWAGSGDPTLRNLRIGQVVMGVAHIGMTGWALSRVATGEVPFQGAAFYHGLAIAGLAGGVWETVRPALELRPKPTAAAAAAHPAPSADVAPPAAPSEPPPAPPAAPSEPPPAPPAAPTEPPPAPPAQP